MNSNLPEHDDADFLSGALHSAADTMPGGEAEEMHLQFGVVRDRVHQRRATKIGGLGVTALAVAGGLAVGAAQLTTFDDEPLLPADPSPSDTRTTEPSPSSSPQNTILDGYLPSDIYEGTPLACGVDEDVVPRSADGSSIRFLGNPYRVGGGESAYAEVELQELPKAGGGTVDFEPAAVWIRDGEVVSLSRYFDPEPPAVMYDEDGLARTVIRLDPVNVCDPPEGAEDVPSFEPVEYEHVLVAGEYEVIPVLWTDVAVGTAEYVTGEPTVVEVLPDGTVATQEAATTSSG